MSALTPHLNNLKYLARHKWAVLRAGIKLGVPLWRLLIHDWSKLTPIEWFAYTNYFFVNPETSGKMHKPASDNYHEPRISSDDVVVEPVEEIEAAAEWEVERNRVARNFDRAWLHHIHHNQHHWNHWILSNDDGSVNCLEMPAHFAREMVADWWGAGRAQGKSEPDALERWYEENKESIKLHSRTREFVEALIKICVHG